MPKDTDTITFRPMTSEDVGAVPIGHQGDEQEVRARIQDLGSSAILAFDATQHVGQLQFRRYAADTRSPKDCGTHCIGANLATNLQRCLTAHSPFTATTSANSTTRTTVTRAIRAGALACASWTLFWTGPSRPASRR